MAKKKSGRTRAPKNTDKPWRPDYVGPRVKRGDAFKYRLKNSPYYDYGWVSRQKQTKETVAAVKLATKYVEEVFQRWGIVSDDDEDCDIESIDPTEYFPQMSTDFGVRVGTRSRSEFGGKLFLDWWAGQRIDHGAKAIHALYQVIDNVEVIAADALERFKNGDLPSESYDFSIEVMSASLRGHLEAGSTEVALILAYHLGRLEGYRETHPHEKHAKKGLLQKKYQSQGGRARAKLTRQQRIDAAQKFHELHATSGMSKTAALKRIGDEFGVSRQTIGRIVTEYSSEK